MTSPNSLIATCRFMHGGCAMAICLLVPSVYAQDSRSTSTLEEVIVTADRQNALNIQEAPIAISVVNTDALVREGAQGYSDYLEALPSVVLRETNRGQNQFVIRGMATGSFNHTDLQDRSLVSVYLDDTPISLQGNTPDLKIYDLERIEVIRGPQGTLYGASAMAGNIRFITVKPDSGKFDASAEGTVAQVERGGTDFSVSGMLNMPFSDDLALRLNAFRGENTGYIDNIGLREKDANGDETTQARGVLRWTPADNLTIDLSHTYAKLRNHGEPTYWRVFVPAPGTPQPFETNNTSVPEAYNDDFNLSNLTMSYRFEQAELVSSTSYVDREFGRFSSGQYLVGRRNLGLDTVPYDSIVSFNNIDNTLQDFTQEIRLQSNQDGRFSWIGGVFYQKTHRTQLQDIPTAGYDTTAFGGFYFANGIVSTSPQVGAPHADDPFFGDQDIKDRQLAVFGEATLEVLPRLDLTLGARYFDWKQDFELYFGGLLGAAYVGAFPVAPLVREGVSGDESGTNPRVALSYRATDNLLLFAEAAKGFRFGGVNQPIPATCGLESPVSFGSDSAWTYQLGEKSTLFSDRLTLNVTGFLTNWSDVQTRRTIVECSYFFLVNEGKVRTQGVEFESRARLADGLLFGLNASYTDATADGPIPNLGARDGDRAPGVPRYQGSATLDYSVPAFSAGQLDFRVSYQYRDGWRGDWVVLPTTSVTPSNDRLDLAVNYLSGRSWEAGVFVRNALDEEEIYSISGERRRRAPQPSFQQANIGPGRTVGVRFRYDF